jgi:hypothetical protein
MSGCRGFIMEEWLDKIVYDGDGEIVGLVVNGVASEFSENARKEFIQMLSAYKRKSRAKGGKVI